MNVLLIILALLVGTGVLAYLRAPLSIATAAAGIGLLVLTDVAHGVLAGLVMLLAWIAWAGLLAMNSATLRQRFLSRPVLTSWASSALGVRSLWGRDGSCTSASTTTWSMGPRFRKPRPTWASPFSWFCWPWCWPAGTTRGSSARFNSSRNGRRRLPRARWCRFQPGPRPR